MVALIKNGIASKKLMKKKFMFKEGNISLILDEYQDIFSDFDPRPYSVKALSHDFLSECKYASREKHDKGLELRLLMPAKKRNKADEKLIAKRLRHHFVKHFNMKLDEQNKIKRHGFYWFIIGTVLIFASTILYHKITTGVENWFFYDLLFVLLEPAGWFTIWTGLEKVIIDSKKDLRDFEFYNKMMKCKINFSSY